jgi:hypothetical protein
MKINISLLFFLALFVACNEKETPENESGKIEPFKTEYKIGDLLQSQSFEISPKSLGIVALKESSGLAYSRKNPGFLWTLQDKGNSNSIYLIDASNGLVVAEYEIDGTFNRDWESLEISSGPDSDLSYLYIGDTGDNNQEYSEYTIYRFEEPSFEENHRSKTVKLQIPFDKIEFEYPDKSHDVEALLVDPHTNDIFLVTKRDLYSLLFALPYPQKTSNKNNAILAGTFPFRIVTAGSVSADGDEVLIKTYDRIFYWKKTAGQSFLEMLGGTPEFAPYEKEAQGEAICFDNRSGYFTLSEWSDGVFPELYYYSRK